MRRSTLALVTAVSAVSLSACGAPRAETTTTTTSTTTTAGAGASSAAPAECAKGSLKTLQPGTLTIGTDKPAYEPWFAGDDPSNGKGYESAVAYAIADRLGYPKDKVRWATVTFNQAIAPGTKPFDLDLNQISISEDRKKALDFSTGYYDVRQAVVALKDTPTAKAKSMLDLEGSRLGAQVGSTSLTAAKEQIAPAKEVAVFDTTDLAVQALKSKQIDGLVLDVPTAFYVTAAQLEGSVIVGQLPSMTGDTEQFGAVLAKNSPLTQCVSQAVDSLRKDGTLDKLGQQWLTSAGAPELK